MWTTPRKSLEKLYLITYEARWRDLAARTLAVFAGDAARSGTFAGSYALALQAHLRKPPQTVVIGRRASPQALALADAAWRTYRPGRLVLHYDPQGIDLDTLPEAVAGAARAFLDDPEPRAYICVGNTAPRRRLRRRPSPAWSPVTASTEISH